MFGLIGHSTSFEDARIKARELGYDEYADGDLDMWCAAPPQLVERVTVTSRTGKQIQGAYIDSVFVPEMLRRFKTAKRKVLKAMELAQKSGITITALGGFTSIIFEDMNLLKEERVSAVELDWQRFTTGNTHTAWVICQQVETNAPALGIDLASAKVAVVGASGDIGSAVCRYLQRRGVGELLLVARRPQPLVELQESLGEGRILSLEEALPEADVVVWVASLPQSLEIDTASLRKPCLMIDGGYPKNLDSKAVAEGVHVLKGGIVEFWQDIGWQMETLKVGECDTGVPNYIASGDLLHVKIDACRAEPTKGRFVACTNRALNPLVDMGLLTGQQKGAITSCVARSK